MSLTDEQDKVEPALLLRVLRHELAGVLQTIYATSAVLQRRLPADAQVERGVLANLMSQADTCRLLLDTLHDFFYEPHLTDGPVDLAELAAALVAKAVRHFPRLQILTEGAGPCVIRADAALLTQLGSLLLSHACQTAEGRVVFRTGPAAAAGEVEWTVSADGAGVPEDQWEQLFQPIITQHGRLGLGLAPARRLARLHGGRFNAANLPTGGWRLEVVLPVQPLKKTAESSRSS